MVFENSSSADSKTVLRRNQACYYCRHRKTRCDGQRPICGPCLRASHEDDCEYTDNLRRSRAEILEEDIRSIQTRINQLEHPEAPNASVSLHKPYMQARDPAQIPGLHQILDTFHEPVLSAPPSMSIKTETGTSASIITDSWWNSDEPPKHMVENFLDTFLPYTSDWGFFLDFDNFRRDALLPLPNGHHSRPSPALLAAVYLAAITLSTSPTLKSHEKTFLMRALSALPISLSGLHPRKVLHGLQAEIILATYFFSRGKFTEGMYHTATAVSLAVSSGLHKIRVEAPSSLAGHSIDSQEAERVDAWFAILTLDKAWAGALGTHSNWNNTRDALETGDSDVLTTDMSPRTLLVNTVVLWERANSLAARWDPEMRAQDSRDFFSAFNTLDEHIENFRRTVTRLAAEGSCDRPIIVGCFIAHAATITLHAPFASDGVSRHKSIAAATAVLVAAADMKLEGVGYINPIVGPVWATACRVVVEEIRVRDGNHDTDELASVFARGFAAMRMYAESCPLMYYHIQKIQDAYNMLAEKSEDAMAEP
ncbi:Zn(2)-C6 fungal-type domain-containing protein [Mycena venus]|uniref:Zn(2)-C6 fungal-type domain-containing protein n=1 Tax=Mycena venus TaxID=2733690 RepID=A0A8H7CTC8_9AGAR|nr:Zn(2)-C6 fungal-type domain-containing protein [Mycena venus]